MWAALRIPGVVPFALTLFFSKLVAYTFLYWLPFYLNSVDIGGRRLTPKVQQEITGAHCARGTYFAGDLPGVRVHVGWARCQHTAAS